MITRSISNNQRLSQARQLSESGRSMTMEASSTAMDFPNHSLSFVRLTRLPPLKNKIPNFLPELPCLLPPVSTITKSSPKFLRLENAYYVSNSRMTNNRVPGYFGLELDKSCPRPQSLEKGTARGTRTEFHENNQERSLLYRWSNNNSTRATTEKAQVNAFRFYREILGDKNQFPQERGSGTPWISESEARSSKCEPSGMAIYSRTVKKRRSQTMKTEKKFFPCPYCDKAVSEKSNLKAHIRIHTGEYPYKCKDQECGKLFMWKSSLTYHTNVVHGGRRPFSCKLCKKRFAEKPKLRVHFEWCSSTGQSQNPPLGQKMRLKTLSAAL